MQQDATIGARGENKQLVGGVVVPHEHVEPPIAVHIAQRDRSCACVAAREACAAAAAKCHPCTLTMQHIPTRRRSIWQAHAPHDRALRAIRMLKPCIVECNHHAARHADAADPTRALNALGRQERLSCVVPQIWKPAPTIQIYTSGRGR